MALPARTPGKLKMWTERLALVSAIATILGLTISGVLGSAWQAVWNVFDPPSPSQTKLAGFDPWLTVDAQKKAESAPIKKDAFCQATSMARPWPGGRRCFIEHIIYDPCFYRWIAGDLVLACTESPWKEPVFVRIRGDRALGASENDERKSPSYSSKEVWAIELAKGKVRCVRGSGGTNLEAGGRIAFMYCDKDAMIVAVSSDTQPWTADYAVRGKTAIERVPIIAAWF
ncbi:hypothetical protein ACIBIZ_11930 [Nonomuraea spiralis]|uniref:hypothetical protein n=1 Tax=Nonomuraea spiralis TaxID=46182 RepID=UPI0037905740